jgi:hypothetical protein
MARAINQIEKDIAALESSVAAIALDLYQCYGNYLKALGPALRRQFIQACYHLCTHGYPEEFLQLSGDERQALQQRLREMAEKAQLVLLNPLNDPSESSENSFYRPEPEDAEPEAPPEEQIGQVEAMSEDISAPDQLEESWSEDDSDFTSDEVEQALLMKIQDAILANLMERDGESSDDDDDEEEQGEEEERFIDLSQIRDRLVQLKRSQSASRRLPLVHPTKISDPNDLRHWQEAVEEMVTGVLRDLSHATNHLFQKANILPAALPAQLLELASRSGMAAEATTAPPNLLSLLIEVRSDDTSEANLKPIMAVRLRLAEIEFSDPDLTQWRNQIRNLLPRIQTLHQNYQKRQQERAIAEAEAAWRTSWYAD